MIVFLSKTHVKIFSTYVQKIEKEQFKTAFAKNNPNLATPKYSFSSAYSLKQTFAHEDNYYLVGEKYELKGNYFDPTEGLTEKYELQDIFVIKLNTGGVFQWMSRIPKKQELGGQLLSFFSFKAFARKNHLLFLFNDSYDNLSEVSLRKTAKATYKNAKLVITQLALEDGTFKRRQLQALIGKKYLTQTEYSYKINENELFFYANGRAVGAKKSIVKTLKLKPE